MRFDANGAHSRTSTTVRNAESLVQVEMTYICSNDAWRCQTHLQPFHVIFCCVLKARRVLVLPAKQHSVFSVTSHVLYSCAALPIALCRGMSFMRRSSSSSWMTIDCAHLCIHVCPVHVYLPSIFVNDIAHLVNTLFIHSMSGWVRHHQCPEPADHKRFNNMSAFQVMMS